jgi:hypothetical protein
MSEIVESRGRQTTGGTGLGGGSYSWDRRKRSSALSIHAQDDRGGMYLSVFDGSTGHGSYESLTLRFRPRLNPLVHALKFTVRGASEEVVVDVELISATEL